MESLATIATKRLETSKSSERITSDSSVLDRREKLYFILTEYREACQYAPLTGDEMEIRISSWLPITAPIPADRLHDSYVWAMQNRSHQFPLSAVELVDAWKHLLNRAETEGTSGLRDDRLLAENAPGACVRCDREGREIHADGSIGGHCDHRPLTKEEVAEAARIKTANLEWARDEAKKTVEARQAQKAKEVKPAVQKLQCSVCRRTAVTNYGWKAGDPCNAPVKINDFCPECKQPSGVRSMNRMVCRECHYIYDYVACAGVLELS